MMEFQTFTIIAGSEACNARCPFCISKMTPPLGVELPEPKVNWRNFKKACKLAHQSGVSTVLITGKGEPTLFPAQISRFLNEMSPFEFPMIEIQTNGIKMAEDKKFSDYLASWYSLGMTTVAISIVHYEPEKNRGVYVPYRKSYIDLPKLIDKLHGSGFSVRLSCVLAGGYIDSPELLKNLLDFATKNNVEQLTVTPVNKPDEDRSRNEEAWTWTSTHHLPEGNLELMVHYIRSNGTHLWTLTHGAKVYDVGGQNLCLNNCLTIQPHSDKVRNLIFYPDGHLRTYWQYPGSVIL